MSTQLRKIFLPNGKSDKRYIKYMGWSFISTICVSLQTTLSTHSMLSAVGDDSTRTVNYIGKDILGQLGGLLFMAKVGKQADKSPRDFIFMSNAIQQTSIMLMSLTPMFPPALFLPMAGLSNSLSNLSFTGYGAINAKCIQEISDQNMGELYTKITMVNTMASTIGMTGGVALCMYIPDHETRTMLIPLIGIARVYSYQKAIEDII
jgi:hypothetical protein